MKLHEDVSVARTEYGLVLLDQAAGRYWQLTGTAAVVVEELTAGRTTEQAVAVLVARFDVTAETARADVEAFLGRLRGTGLVVG
jgi:hypothetical protein